MLLLYIYTTVQKFGDRVLFIYLFVFLVVEINTFIQEKCIKMTKKTFTSLLTFTFFILATLKRIAAAKQHSNWAHRYRMCGHRCCLQSHFQNGLSRAAHPMRN